MWYFWFALLIGILITFLLVCKYNNQKINDQLPIVWNQSSLMTSESQNFKPNFNNNNKNHYLYKPIKYNEDYLVRISFFSSFNFEKKNSFFFFKTN
jgi:hypothetical protein